MWCRWMFSLFWDELDEDDDEPELKSSPGPAPITPDDDVIWLFIDNDFLKRLEN